MGARQRKSKRKGQLGLPLKKRFTWGGARKGAGRKRSSRLPSVPRRARERLDGLQALHVTWRVLPEVWNLRSKRAFREVLRAFAPAAERFGTRVTRFSVQGNHVHLIVEAESSKALSRAMQGLAIRLARGLNRMMGRSGTVFADRYHARALRTPREAWNAIRYVMRNHQIHAARQGRATTDRPDPYAVGPAQLEEPEAWWRRVLPAAPPIAPPVGWLLSAGWRRGAPPGTAAELPA